MKKLSVSSLLLAVILISCGPAADKLPSAPTDVAFVTSLIKAKKFVVKKVGLASPILTQDNQLSVNWIDATQAGGFEKEAEEEIMKFSVEFVNDTSVVVVSREKRFEGTYSVDDTMDQYDKEEGIKIRLTYVDPDLSFGSEPTEITFTYPVKGAGDNKLLLQFPRSINRQPVVALLSE